MPNGPVVFNGDLYRMDNKGNVHSLFAKKKRGRSRLFKVGAVHYYIDADRRVWRFYEDAVTALGAQGTGVLDMPEGVGAQPGTLNDLSGLWCRLDRTADREVMLDYIIGFNSFDSEGGR